MAILAQGTRTDASSLTLRPATAKNSSRTQEGFIQFAWETIPSTHTSWDKISFKVPVLIPVGTPLPVLHTSWSGNLSRLKDYHDFGSGADHTSLRKFLVGSYIRLHFPHTCVQKDIKKKHYHTYLELLRTQYVAYYWNHPRYAQAVQQGHPTRLETPRVSTQRIQRKPPNLDTPHQTK